MVSEPQSDLRTQICSQSKQETSLKQKIKIVIPFFLSNKKKVLYNLKYYIHIFMRLSIRDL